MKFWLLGLTWVMLVLACNSPATSQPAAELQVVTEPATLTAPAPPTPETIATTPPPTELPTQTQSPEATTEPVEITATTGMQCTVVQDLNLRTGPGIAFRNPIGVVTANTVVFPSAYNPAGFPGGDWVFVDQNNQQGWIAAGPDFISCNFDLAALPSVDIDPPSPPPPPGSVLSSTPDGNCGENTLDCQVIFSDTSFIEFNLIDQDLNVVTDHVVQVSFSVREDDQNGTEVFNNIETNPAYCIFGGDGPCNEWPIENYRVVWYSGVPVVAGTYFVEILATLDDEQSTLLRWAAEVKLELP